MRIGLLGGTFNPIHRGHLQMAERVLNRLKLDRVFFIPTGKAPHKKETGMASQTDRWIMVCRALQETPSFKPCDIEIKRKGVSYTVDTLIALKRRHPQDTFFFIIGTDAFSRLPEWKAPEQLLGLCHFVIVPRADHPFWPLPKLALWNHIDRTAIKQLDEKRRNRYTFRTPHGTRIYFLRAAVRPIAASEIRTILKRGPLKTKKFKVDKAEKAEFTAVNEHFKADIQRRNSQFLEVPKNVSRLLPESVWSYIMAKGLYQNQKESNSQKGRKAE